VNRTLSSTAKRSYWLGRYLERAESTARLIMVNASLLYDLPKRLPLGWQPLVDITGGQALFATLYSEPSEKNVTRFLINDAHNPASLFSSLNWIREDVRILRGIIPRQAIEYVNEFYLFAKESLSAPLSRTRRVQGLSRIPEFVQRLDGFMSANMLHDAHWTFLRLGNFIERADMTSRIIDVGCDNLFEAASKLEPFIDIQWRSVLLSLDAAQSYNTVVQSPVNQGAVLDFLICNESLPRSLAYSLNSLRNGLQDLPRNTKILTAINRLRRSIRQTDVAGLEGEELRRYLDGFQIQLARIDQAIAGVYFASKPESQLKSKPKAKSKKELTGRT